MVSKTIRQFCIGTLVMALSMAPLNSYALKVDEIDMIQGFLKSSGLSQHAVSLKDLYAKFKNDMPKDIQQDFESLLKAVPNVQVPKVSVRKVKNELGEEDLQLIFNDSSGSAILTIVNRENVFATLKGNQGGRSVNLTIAPNDLQNLDFFEKLGMRRMSPRLSLVLLSADQVNQLKQKEKIKYFKELRQLMTATEKAQNLLEGNQNKTSSAWSFLMDSAWALQGSCIIAGYMGDYRGTNSCQLPGDYQGGVCSAKQVQCNPDIYGANICVDYEKRGRSLRVPLEATSKCNDGVVAKENDVVPEVKTKEDFNKFKTELEKKINGLTDTCASQVYPNKNKLPRDQASTCDALNARVEHLKNLECKQLPGTQKFSGLKCDDPAPPVPLPQDDAKIAKAEDPPSESKREAVPPPAEQLPLPVVATEGGGSGAGEASGTCMGPCPPEPPQAQAVAPPVVESPSSKGSDGGAGEKQPAPEPPPKEIKKQEKPPAESAEPKAEKIQDPKISKEDAAACEGFKTFNSNLSCRGNQVKVLSCPNGSVQYCECDKNEVADFAGTKPYAVSCRVEAKTSSPASAKSSSSASSSKGWFSWWTPGMTTAAIMVGVGGAAFGLGYMVYKMMKKNMDNQFKMLNNVNSPVNPPVPPPLTAPTSGPAPPTGSR